MYTYNEMEQESAVQPGNACASGATDTPAGLQPSWVAMSVISSCQSVMCR